MMKLGKFASTVSLVREAEEQHFVEPEDSIGDLVQKVRTLDCIEQEHERAANQD